MLTNKIVVAIIKKSTIQAASVDSGEVHDPIEMAWTEEQLRRALKLIKERYQSDKIRVVLGEDLSHTLNVTIPASPSPSEERQIVANRVRDQVPQFVATDSWDYKVVSEDGENKNVVVFVPLQSAFISLTEAAKKEGLVIEAVEPEGVTKLRHTDLFIGMAEKTDLRGRDEEVLNVRPVFTVQEEKDDIVPKKDTLEEGGNMDRGQKFPKWLILVIALLLLAGLVYGVLAYSGALGRPAPSPSPSPTPLVATPTPSPSPEPVDLSEYSVNVLNGSGVVGRAGEIATLLEQAGFSEPTTGNADNYDYTTTEIKRKTTVPDSVVSEIELALGTSYKTKEGSKLGSSSEYDIVVIVGTKTGEVTSSPAPAKSPVASVKPSSSASPSPSGSASASKSPSPSP